MRKAKYILFMMMLSAAIALSGCTLALDEQEYSRDRLVGISVRLGSSASVMNSGVNRYKPHEVDGEMLRLNYEYSEEYDCWSVGPEYDDGGWFDPAHLHVKSTDEGEEYSLETTIYVVESMLPDSPYLQMEHVYQREDGSLYAISGNSYSGHLGGLGLTVSETYSETGPDGETTAFTTVINLSVRYEEHVLCAQAVEMKGSGEELARHDLTGQEEIWISPETEWVLIEETLAGGTVRRTAVNAPLNKETFVLRTPGTNGVCSRETYRLRVPGPLSDETRPG